MSAHPVRPRSTWRTRVAALATISLFASGAFLQCAPASAEDISGIELFEIVALGRNVEPLWQGELQLLPPDVPVDIKLLLNAGTDKPAGVVKRLERVSRQVRDLVMITALIESKRITTGLQEVDGLCSGALPLPQDSDTSRLLIIVGSTLDKCFDQASADSGMAKTLGLPPQKADPDFAKNGLIRCASRLLSAGDGKAGKTMVVFASTTDDAKGLNSLQLCIFDRTLSFLGFRGRLAIDPPRDFDQRVDQCGSVRCIPTYEIVPTVKDLMMAAAMYKFLAGKDYSSEKQNIAALLRGLD